MRTLADMLLERLNKPDAFTLKIFWQDDAQGEYVLLDVLRDGVHVDLVFARGKPFFIPFAAMGSFRIVEGGEQ